MTKHIGILESDSCDSTDSDSSDSVVHIPYVKPPPPCISLCESDDDAGVKNAENQSGSTNKNKNSKTPKSKDKEGERRSKDKNSKTSVDDKSKSRKPAAGNKRSKQRRSEVEVNVNQEVVQGNSPKRSTEIEIVVPVRIGGSTSTGTLGLVPATVSAETTNRDVEHQTHTQGRMSPGPWSVGGSINVISSCAAPVASTLSTIPPISSDVQTPASVPGTSSGKSTSSDCNETIASGLGDDELLPPIHLTISSTIFEKPSPKPRKKRNTNTKQPSPAAAFATTKKKSAIDFANFLKGINLPDPTELMIVTAKPRVRKDKSCDVLAGTSTATPSPSFQVAVPVPVHIPVSVLPQALLGDPNEINIHDHDDHGAQMIDTNITSNGYVSSPIQDATPITQPQGIVNISIEPSTSRSNSKRKSQKSSKSASSTTTTSPHENPEEDTEISAQELASTSVNIQTNLQTSEGIEFPMSTPSRRRRAPRPRLSEKQRKSKLRKEAEADDRESTSKSKSKSPTKRKRSSSDKSGDRDDRNILWGAYLDSNTQIPSPQNIFPGVRNDNLYQANNVIFPSKWTQEMREFYGPVRDEDFDVKEIVRGQSRSRKHWKAPLDDGLPFPKRKKFWCHKCRTSHEANDCHKSGGTICSVCSKHHWVGFCPNRICLNCGAPSTLQKGKPAFPIGCKECLWNRKLPPCSICHVIGHVPQACPDNWRRYHSTTINIPETIEELESMKPGFKLAKANWNFYQTKKRSVRKKIEELQSDNPGTNTAEKVISLTSLKAEMNTIAFELESLRITLLDFKSKVETFKKQVYPSIDPRRKVHSYCGNCSKKGHQFHVCGEKRMPESRNFHPNKPFIIRELANTLPQDQIERISEIIEVANFDLDSEEEEKEQETLQMGSKDCTSENLDPAAEINTREKSPEIEIVDVQSATDKLQELQPTPPLLNDGPVCGPSPKPTVLASSTSVSSVSSSSANSIFAQDIIEPNFDVDERIFPYSSTSIPPVFVAQPHVHGYPFISSSQQLPPPIPLFNTLPQPEQQGKIPVLVYVSPEEYQRYQHAGVEPHPSFLSSQFPQIPPLQPLSTSGPRQQESIIDEEQVAPDSTSNPNPAPLLSKKIPSPTKKTPTQPMSTPSETPTSSTSSSSPSSPGCSMNIKNWNQLKSNRSILIDYLESNLEIKIIMKENSIRITGGDPEKRRIARANLELFLKANSEGTKFTPDLELGAFPKTNKRKRERSPSGSRNSSPEIVDLESEGDDEREADGAGENGRNQEHDQSKQRPVYWRNYDRAENRNNWNSERYNRGRGDGRERQNYGNYNNYVDGRRQNMSHTQNHLSRPRPYRRYQDRNPNTYYNNRDRDNERGSSRGGGPSPRGSYNNNNRNNHDHHVHVQSNRRYYQ